MIKRLLAALFALIAAGAFAAVDVNKATQAEIESVKGVGPAIAGKILDERKKASFKDWADMVERVKGVGEGNAAKFSAEGLTVNGQGFKGTAAPAKTTAKADKAPRAAAAAPKTDDKPSAKAVAAKADDKTAAAPKADDKAAAKSAKADKKAAKAEAAASATAAKK